MAQLQAQTMKRAGGWRLLAATGSAMVIIGLVIGFQKAGGLCGSVFSPKSPAAEIFDTLIGSYGGADEECRDSIASMAVPTWGLIFLGILVILVGILVRAIVQSRQIPIVAFQDSTNYHAQLQALEQPQNIAKSMFQQPQATAPPMLSPSSDPQAASGYHTESRPVMDSRTMHTTQMKVGTPPRSWQMTTSSIAAIAFGAWGSMTATAALLGGWTEQPPTIILGISSFGSLVFGILILATRRQSKRPLLILLLASVLGGIILYLLLAGPSQGLTVAIVLALVSIVCGGLALFRGYKPNR